jgi:hypothetical protein
VKRILTAIAALAIALTLSCGGGNKPAAPKAAAPKTEAPAAITANVPAGWPTGAFGELTKPEMEAYAKVLPNVMAELKKSGFKPVQSNPPDLVRDMGATIEAMKTAGVEAVLKSANMTWDAYRTTTYRVMAATNAMVLGMAEAMAGDSTSKEAQQARAILKKAKPVFDQVPKANGQMLFTYMDQLKPLDEIEGPTK